MKPQISVITLGVDDLDSVRWMKAGLDAHDTHPSALPGSPEFRVAGVVSLRQSRLAGLVRQM